MAKWEISCPQCRSKIWMPYDRPQERPQTMCAACGNLIVIHDGRTVVAPMDRDAG